MRTAYIFFLDGYVSVAPTIVSMGYSLAEHYDNVIICARHVPPYKDFCFKNDIIKIVYCDEYIPQGKNCGKLKNFLRGLVTYFWKFGFPQKKDLIVCVDDKIFPFSFFISKFFRTDFTYLSLEIPTERVGFFNKFLFKSVRSVLIQDNIRLKALLDSYACSEKNKKIFYIPNAFMGDFNYQSNSSDLLGQFKGVDFSGKVVCAQIGMIEKQVYSDVLAEVFSSLEEVFLIFHDRRKINMEEAFVQELLSVNQNNLLFSQIIYDFDELFLAYQSIDIGLACYKYVDDNFGLIGKASGKLAFYFFFKKPVIVNRLEGYSELIEEYQCGIVINDITDSKEWKNAIETIMANYEFYSQNAYKCYENEFDFKKYVEPYLKFIIE